MRSTTNHLVKMVLDQNYLQLNRHFYIFLNELAMVSPLSGILSEIYFNHIKNKYICSEVNKMATLDS